MKKCNHIFNAINNSSSGYYGICLYCIKCGEAFAYNEDWSIISLKGREG
jgi:hypothetical protein